ncbi:hypothetical protein E2562_000544 [Oryza meyeriana var. granulata]|uniref:Uncharacterized protein n=1 Tax=Oryza meyeriana var. granulata TaxID=110450 RepID=A0A6G1DTP8_9ORYZ|nr:hypothetical protein E2562_000544 [Oryza meyeriana var. granulata]
MCIVPLCFTLSCSLLTASSFSLAMALGPILLLSPLASHRRRSAAAGPCSGLLSSSAVAMAIVTVSSPFPPLENRLGRHRSTAPPWMPHFFPFLSPAVSASSSPADLAP